jgi:hypothetical protein
MSRTFCKRTAHSRNQWCVKSHFSIPAMKVKPQLENGQEAYFEAYILA